jgi:Dolichyl-phosphate-mannose-protein mannosyltransferase
MGDRAVGAGDNVPVLRVILLAFVVLCAVNNVVLPVFEASDEASHYTYAAYLAREKRFPDLNRELPAHEAAQPPLYYVLTAVVISPFDHSNLAEISQLNPDWFDRDVNPDFVSVKNLHVHTDAENYPYRGAVWGVRAARAWSALLGAVTVALVYAIALIVRHGDRTAAALAAALVAFNPKFVHVSSIVSNDIAIICAATLTCWWLCRMLALPAAGNRGSHFALLGGLIGVTVLCKLGGLALWLPALLAIVGRAGERQPRAIARGFVLMLAGFVLISGAWFLYNVISYGDPLAFDRVRAANESLRRAMPLSLAQMLATIPQLFISYFGVIGLDLALPRPVVAAYVAGFALAVIGCVRLATQALTARSNGRDAGQTNWPLLALVLWQLALFVLYVPWLRDYVATENGRLIMPGIALSGALTAAGWLALLPRTVRAGTAATAGAALFGLSLATPFVTIKPAFAAPEALDEAHVLAQFNLQPSNTVFDGRVKLLHAQLGATRLSADEPVRVTLYWGAVRSIDQSYRTIIEAVDSAGRVVASRKFIPFGGRFETRRWQPGVFFADDYTLPLPPSGEARVLTVQIGLYRIYGEPQRVPIDGAGTGVFVAGRVKTAPARTSLAIVTANSRATFDGALQLDDVLFGPDELTFEWSVLRQPQADYTLFVHVLDDEGRQIGQQDAQPFDGQYPTGLWDAGERVRDVRGIVLPPEARRIRIGWYDGRNGERLAALRSDGSSWPDNTVMIERP